MNLLKTFTLATENPDTFMVYWTNTLMRPRGLLRICVMPQVEDRQIVAELAAMRYLLEDKAVVGNGIVGNTGTRLIVSLGAIRKLQAMKSDKPHLAPYANFLTTRFAGCPVSVDKDKSWFDGFPPESAEDLLVSAPKRETLTVAGYGEVSVTHHVLERIADRFLSAAERSAQTAWKKLLEVASDASVREVARHALWASAQYDRPGKQEGRYFLNARRNLVLVVTDNPNEGKRLVTAYPVSKQFHELPRAA